MTNSKAVKQYLSQQVMSASPHRLVMMLFQRALSDMARGHSAIEQGKRADANQELQHAQAVIWELRTGLRDDVDLSSELDALYGFCLGQLIQANVYQDLEALESVQGILGDLAEAWQQIQPEAQAVSGD